ncbi:MAG: hypothetical protein A2516_05845 [Alphaproteobacteria bacterium RIFOXYD12_FULL_60_8]|nr:MAG: hypothetical protein A2516_05845 [Alphaproteobacteria bacterium RIFOXYD12_FULL_60_8]
MLKKLTASLFGTPAKATSQGPDNAQLAAAALLMEAALMDGAMGAEEEAAVSRLLRERFALDETQCAKLLDAGKAKAENAVELYSFTKVVKDAFTHEERVDMIEMLWQVVYADGVLHDYEANLITRVCGLIYVSGPDSGAAKRRALAKLGLN